MSVSATDNLSVLFVDDQPLLLKTLQRVIRKNAPDWKVRVAISGKEALKKLEEEACEIIVSDMRMPAMDGVSLLQTVKNRYPNLLRFILSGESSPKSILNSVGIAHQFFQKPIEINEIVEALELSRSLYKRIQDPDLQNLISTVTNLPTPKEVYFKISKMLNEPMVDLMDVANVISEDVSISAKILQMVNSAFFGNGSKLDNIQDAVSTLGIQNIQSLILMIGLESGQNKTNSIISIESYAHHSLEVAQLCRWLAKRSGQKMKDQDSLFTAGLLHNVGKLVLLDRHAQYYRRMRIKEDPYQSRLIIEKEGVEKNSHALTGAALLALWGLPARIVNAVAFHHDPEHSADVQSNYAMFVHIAEAVVNFRKNSDEKGSVFESEYINTQYFEELGLRNELETRIKEYEDLAGDVH